jgi:hypothetical protein
MFKTITLIAALTFFGVFSAFAQVQSTSKTSGTASGKGSVNKGPNQMIAAGTIVDAELMNSLDVRKSKVGDQVLLRTSKAIKSNGDTVVAKGTTLVGRITEIQQKTKDNAQSRIGMLFDRIEGKNLNAPISVSILSMTGLRSAAGVGDSDAFADTGLMSSSSASAQRSSNSGGGGLLGGVGNTVGGVVNTTTQTAGNVVGGVTQTTGNVVNGVTRTAGNTVGSVGQTVNGIQISQSMGGSASGSTSFSSQRKDLRIEKGVTFNVQFNNGIQN